ncbi:DUF3833 domain-containing protein [Nitrincola tibetensis]|uniref:DUF3833 domain-containing protein n=2 Tax=Nitrincola tibetensis TaxID=2219697 RepID=A0A364NKL7_9GAMM|nr:DUF3833 domain-containing protein [Nitrincola tibetensis]
MLARSLTLSLLLLLITGCSNMNIEHFDKREPKLVLEDFFDGKVYAWGIFEDRFGKLRREFIVEIDGQMENGNLVLDELFLYSDGELDRRIWTITPQGNGQYSGAADDIIGQATGQIKGNTLHWVYDMNLKVGDDTWKVNFDDWMYLQPGGVLINRATIRKWGFELGTVTLSFSRGEHLNHAPFSLSEHFSDR